MKAARTTLNLDAEALALAMQHAHGLNKTEVINLALRDFGRRKQAKKLLGFRGRAPWEGDLEELRRLAGRPAS